MHVLVSVRTATAPRLTADDISLPQFAVVDLTDQPSRLQLGVLRDLAFSVEGWRDGRVLPAGIGLPRYGTSWHDGESFGPRCSAKCRLFGSKQGFHVERIHNYEAIFVERGLLPWSLFGGHRAYKW